MRHRPPLRSRHGTRGLSLLEVLVTIVIFAMLFAVLSFGWFQSMNAQARLASASERVQRHQQLSMQLRSLISETLVPPYQAGTEFSGDRAGLVAESTSSLDPSAGAAPTKVELKLAPEAGGIRLQLRHGDTPARSLPWLFSQISLRYLDSKGLDHESWPPAPERAGDTLPLDRDSYLPSLVLISYRLDGEEQSHTLLVAPRSSTWRLTEPTPPIIGIGLN